MGRARDIYPLGNVLMEYAKGYDAPGYKFHGVKFTLEKWEEVKEYFRVIYGAEIGDSVDYFGCHLESTSIAFPTNFRFTDTYPVYSYAQAELAAQVA